MPRTKIKDVEKFKKMWNQGVPGDLIAETFGIERRYVYRKRKTLGLASRKYQRYPYAWIKKAKERTRDVEERVIKNVTDNNGFSSKNQLLQVSSASVINRMVLETKIIRVSMDLGRYPGGFKRNVAKDVFKDGYHKRVFYCLGRTGVVRLMQVALKKPKNKEIRQTLVYFMRSHLTEAEKIAVLWKLGCRKWSRNQVKSSIQVDGVLMPCKKP